MKIKTPLTKERLRNHFTYSIWKYILAVGLCIVCVNLLYTTTAYRSPEHLRVDLYVQSPTATDEYVDAFMNEVWKNSVPEMETVDSIMLTSTSDDYYGDMQLSIYIMAREGDIYILRSQDYKKFASQGCFMDLAEYIDEGVIDTGDIDLSAGYVSLIDENGLPYGDKQLFGIPCKDLPGFKNAMYVDSSDLVLGVTVYNGNTDNVIAFVNELLRLAKTAESPFYVAE